MRAILALALLAALARCGAPEPKPPPVAAPRPAPPVAPTPSAPALAGDWQDWPVSPGDWAYRRDDRGSAAMFGPVGADADFVVRCDAFARRVFVSRKGAFPPGETGRMTLRATSGLATYAVSNTGGEKTYVAAELASADRHLDALGFSRGRFLVSVKGASDLVVPAWPELARVIEDCRSANFPS